MGEMQPRVFGPVTVSTHGSLVVRDPSLTVTVIVAVPDWLAAGVTVTVRDEPLPPRMMLPSGTSAGLDEVAVTTRLAAAVSRSPTVKAIAPVDVSSFVIRSAISAIVGPSFTAVTVSRNGSLAVSAPSLTVSVMVAVPD